MTRKELKVAEARLAKLTKKTVKDLREIAKEDSELKGVASMKKQSLLYHLMLREGFLMELIDDLAVIIDTDENDEDVVGTDTQAENTPAPVVEESTDEKPENTQTADTTENTDSAKTKKSASKPAPKVFVKLGTVHSVITDMVAEKPDMITCPLTRDGKPCRHEKDPEKLICQADYKKPYGRKAVEMVREAIEEYIPKDVFWNGVNAAKSLIDLDEDGPEEIKALPDFLKTRPEFSGIKDKTLRKMVGVAKSKLEKVAEAKARAENEANEAATKKAKNDDKMGFALEEIEKACPAPGFLKAENFYGKLTHSEHGKITNGMVDVACNMLWRGNEDKELEPRWKKWGSTARDLCDRAVEAEWPKDKDPDGKKINESFFTDEVIAKRALEHLGKLVTEKMMMNACRAAKRERMNEKFSKRAAKPSQDDVAALDDIEGVSYNGQTAGTRR